MFRVPLFLTWMTIVVLLTLRRPFFGALVILLHFVLHDFLVRETYEWYYGQGFELLYITTMVGVLTTRPQRLGEFWPRSMVDWGMVGFLMAMVASAMVNGVQVFDHKYIDLFFKATVLYFLVSRLADTPRRVTILALVLVLSTSFLVYLAWDKYRSGQLKIARPYDFSNYHEFGLQLVITLPLVGALVFSRFRLIFRAFFFLLVPLYVLIALRCWSRSAFLGIVLGIALLAWYYRRRWYVGLAAVPFVAFAVVHQHEYISQRLESVWTHKTGIGTVDTSISQRLEQMRTAMNIISAHPVFGIGPRQFFAQYEMYASPGDRLGGTYTMHSVPLLILCEEGGLGFAVYYGLIVLGSMRAAYFAARKTRDAPELETVAVVGAGALMGYLAWMAYSLTTAAMWTINIYGTVALVEAARRVVLSVLAEQEQEETELDMEAAAPAPVSLPPPGTTEVAFS